MHPVCACMHPCMCAFIHECVKQTSLKLLYLSIFGKLLVLMDFYALQIVLGFLDFSLKLCE